MLIAGAGDAGQLVIREMQRNRQLGYTPIGLIDDDPRKKNLRIHGIRVLGTTEELAHILRDNRPDEVLIAIPSASGEARQRIVTVTRENNVPVKTLPGLYELISGESDLATQIRPVQVEDVLGREPVEVDLETSAAYLKGKTVLVTAAWTGVRCLSTSALAIFFSSIRNSFSIPSSAGFLQVRRRSPVLSRGSFFPARERAASTLSTTACRTLWFSR